ELDIFVLVLLEAGSPDGHGISAGLEVREDEIAGARAGEGTDVSVYLVDDVNLGARDGRAGGVDDAAADGAAGALSECGCGREQGRDSDDPQRGQSFRFQGHCEIHLYREI